MRYNSPTLTFLQGVFGITKEIIQEPDSDFWKGFRLLFSIAFYGLIFYGLYYVSITWFIWTVPAIVLFFVTIDVISWIGSYL